MDATSGHNTIGAQSATIPTLSGDGSPLPTDADGNGKRACDCDFGHHFYELGVFKDGTDYPLHVRIDPANETDHTAAMNAMDWLGQALRDEYPGFASTTFIGDAGHDGAPMYRFCQDWSMNTVIPLSRPAPATHPSRGEVPLSEQGVPMCQANIEMSAYGTAGKDRRPLFICALRANKIALSAGPGGTRRLALHRPEVRSSRDRRSQR